jgi:hypothetical protein
MEKVNRHCDKEETGLSLPTRLSARQGRNQVITTRRVISKIRMKLGYHCPPGYRPDKEKMGLPRLVELWAG